MAVWPDGGRAQQFAEDLQTSGEFSVVPLPDTVTITEREKLEQPQSAAEGQAAGFEALCRLTDADLVFAATDGGTSDDKNLLSFERGTTTYLIDLQGFSCAQHAVRWREQMALIVVHGKVLPTTRERDEVAGALWAERVVVSKNVAARENP